MVFALRFAGYDAQATADGRECLELAKKQHPELILLGASMGETREFGVYRALKDDQGIGPIPIVLLVDEGQEFDDKTGLEGMSIIHKPTSPDALTRWVNAFFKKTNK